MQKLFNIICERCRTICDKNPITRITKKGKTLHFCSINCLMHHSPVQEWKKWLKLRADTKDDNGKLCYCGHTNRCNCTDPGLQLFKESVKRNTIILNDPDNGWKKYTNNKRS